MFHIRELRLFICCYESWLAPALSHADLVRVPVHEDEFELALAYHEVESPTCLLSSLTFSDVDDLALYRAETLGSRWRQAGGIQDRAGRERVEYRCGQIGLALI